MGRKKLAPDLAKTSFLHVRMTRAEREWINALKDAAGDTGDTAMLFRVLAREAKRLKLPPVPAR